MFGVIYLFEISYRFQRPATHIYFALVFLFCFVAVTSPSTNLDGSIEAVRANSPYVISALLLLVSAYMAVVTSAVMGVAIIRDFDHGMSEILFSTSVSKWDYLMGRFLGSFTVLLVIGFASILGLLCGYSIGEFLPWKVIWKDKEILEFNVWHYLQPFFVLVISNLFITGSLFFTSGALGRRHFVVYTQGILLILLYQIGIRFLEDSSTRQFAILMDPFGIQAFIDSTKYWSSAEKNSMLLSFDGWILYNRLLWIGVGFLGLLFTYLRFSMDQIPRRSSRPSKDRVVSDEREKSISIPRKVSFNWGVSASWSRAWRGALFYSGTIAREIPFQAIVASGLLTFFVNAFKMDDMYGASSYPVTAAVIQLFDSFTFFLIVIAIFYSGELIWSDRTLRMSPIMEALPVSDFSGLLSKLWGLALLYILILVMLLLAGVGVQLARGHYDIRLEVYFQVLFGGTLSFILLFTILFFFIQVLVNNKFLGFVVCIFVMVTELLLVNFGIETDLLLYAGGTLNTFSDMNGFGHFAGPLVWMRVYWASFAVILFILATVGWRRGHDATKIEWRRKLSGLTERSRVVLIACATVFVVSGSLIYYNTNILNAFKGRLSEQSPTEENIFLNYDSLGAPKVVEVFLQVDIFPRERDFKARGHYYLKNESKKTIQHLFIQLNRDPHLRIDTLAFDREATREASVRGDQNFIYRLLTPLDPGDSVKMNFQTSFLTFGFELRKSNTQIVYNGTFLDQSYFPSMKGSDARDMDSVQPMYADRIRFEAIVSTDIDQIAIAPGRLEREWEEQDRKYFHYKMGVPMINHFSIHSGQYKVYRERWHNVPLEVYHHESHHKNVTTMIKAMKDALQYCSENIGPYPFTELRIVEFPRYRLFAPSSPTLIPFSEAVQFILRVEDPDRDLDVVYYSTARQVAYQWWGTNLMPANANGKRLLSDGLSQYYALMILNKTRSPESMEKYLRYELNGYLTGRSREKTREQSLWHVENQDYLYFNKASVVFFALQDYIGEQTLNKANRLFYEKWHKSKTHPTTQDFLTELATGIPDSLSSFVRDSFEKITLYENKIENAIYDSLPNGKFELTFTIACEKKASDSIGYEIELPLDDWIDIGVYGSGEEAASRLIFLKKHKITQRTEILTVITTEKPAWVGIDPLHKLVDRHLDDNTIKVKESAEFSGLTVFDR